jgi:hypothetical protein
MVMSTLGLSLPLGLGWHYFSFELCHSSCYENKTTAQWVLLVVIQRIYSPPGLAKPRERGRALSIARTKMKTVDGKGLVHCQDSMLREAKDSTNGLRRGGNSEGTHLGSTRIPPLHGTRRLTVS